MKTQPLYRHLATLLQRHHNIVNGNFLRQPMLDAIEEEIDRLVKDHLPSGSGIDSGVTLNYGRCFRAGRRQLEYIDFTVPFHCMNEVGMYTGWATFGVVVTPDWDGINLKVVNRDDKCRGKGDIRDYLADLFYQALVAEVEGDPGVVSHG